MSKSLEDSVAELEVMLMTCVFDDGSIAWETLVDSCGEDCEMQVNEALEERVDEYLTSLSEEDMFSVWKESAVGRVGDYPPEERGVETVKMDLHEELLAQVMNKAFEESLMRN